MPDLSRSRLLTYAAGAAVILVLGLWTLRRDGGARPAGATGSSAAYGRAPTGAPAAASGADGADAGVRVEAAPASAAVVHVAGAVRHPGVYRLPGGARVQDAVRRAGGRSHGADLNAINLAAKVVDGQQVVVPRRAAAPASAAPGGDAATADPAAGGPAAAPVGLNAASETQLETLDGVGPAMARKIIEWRTAHGGFRSVDDLGQVSGIGPKRLAALRAHVQP